MRCAWVAWEQVEVADDEVDGEDEESHHGQEEEQTPAGAEAIVSEEEAAEGGLGWLGFSCECLWFVRLGRKRLRGGRVAEELRRLEGLNLVQG